MINQDTIIEMLRESNAIEGVFDDVSLMEAVYAWEYLQGIKRLTNSAVQKTHKILMAHQPLLPNEIGQYRERPVYIGGKAALPAEEIRGQMTEWCLDMNDGGGEEQSRWLHVEYERIHPFIDGNGRTGRIFMNWWRVRHNLPILVIHTGDEQVAYYQWFR